MRELQQALQESQARKQPAQAAQPRLQLQLQLQLQPVTQPAVLARCCQLPGLCLGQPLVRVTAQGGRLCCQQQVQDVVESYVSLAGKTRLAGQGRCSGRALVCSELPQAPTARWAEMWRAAAPALPAQHQILHSSSRSMTTKHDE